MCNQFQEVLADERLPAGEQEHRHPELGEVVDERLPLRGRQLVRRFLLIGRGVAVLAVEVTPLRGVPDDDRALLFVVRDLGFFRPVGRVVSEPVAFGVEPTEELADGDHRDPSVSSTGAPPHETVGVPSVSS